jgi:hypothetical protein
LALAPTAVRDAPPHPLSSVQALGLQGLAGNGAVAEALQRPVAQRGEVHLHDGCHCSARAMPAGFAAGFAVQRVPPTPAPASTSGLPALAPPATAATAPPATAAPATAPPPAAPTWKSIDEATSALVQAFAEGDRAKFDAARSFVFPRLNGMNPEGLVAALTTVQRIDTLYYVVAAQKGVDVPRLSTAIAGVMSNKPADTIAALEMLDDLRNTGGSEAFWTERIAPMSASRLRSVLLVADRTVIVALRDALDQAPPKVHRKVGPVLGRMFNPPASDIVLEFVPDQFDMPALITLPDGTTTNGLAPVGVLTAKVAGRVAASVPAQGGMWQSQDAGGGHHADPTKPGVHKLGGREKVRTSFWAASQLAQGTPLREVSKAGKPAVEYRGDDGRWHDTKSLAKPISRDDILAFVTGLRKQLSDPAALALVPDGVVPSTWIFNDFGDHAYRILGTDELVHTSPAEEIEYRAGIHEQLGWSHGCLHLRPSDRDRLEKLNLLKGGVTLKVHAYVKGVKEYGKAPGF